MTPLKGIFWLFRFLLHPQIPDFPYPNKPDINGKLSYWVYKKDPYDWFCSPGSHI